MSDLLKTVIEAKTRERSSLMMIGSLLALMEENASPDIYEAVKNVVVNYLRSLATDSGRKAVAESALRHAKSKN